MSDWQEVFEARVFALLQSERFVLRSPHHFGSAFVTAYQLAVAFYEEYEDICLQFGKGIGGEFRGMANLETYFAEQLSRNFSDDYPVEGAWLHASGLDNLRYQYGETSIEARPNSDHGGYSMFRWRR